MMKRSMEEWFNGIHKRIDLLDTRLKSVEAFVMEQRNLRRDPFMNFQYDDAARARSYERGGFESGGTSTAAAATSALQKEQQGQQDGTSQGEQVKQGQQEEERQQQGEEGFNSNDNVSCEGLDASYYNQFRIPVQPRPPGAQSRYKQCARKNKRKSSNTCGTSRKGEERPKMVKKASKYVIIPYTGQMKKTR